MAQDHTTELKGKTILVTGAAGFIGSHLSHTLLNLGATVRGLDDFSTGKRTHLAHASQNSKFSLVEGDINELPQNLHWLQGCDAICHQAALGSVPRSIEKPLISHKSNSTGFLALLEAARDLGIRRVVYASSSSVYGDIQYSPKVEDKVGAPLSPYAITKITNELYAGVYANLHSLETIGLRYFNVFGSRQDPEGPYSAVIPRFFQAIISGQSPTIYGDGEQSRDFTHVSNVVTANILALTTQNTKAFGKSFNVGCGENTSVNELFQAIQSVIRNVEGLNQPSHTVQIQPKYSGPRAGDVVNSLASLVAIKEALGYQPITSLQDGLAEAAVWYQMLFSGISTVGLEA